MIKQNRAAIELMDGGYLPDPDTIGEWVGMDSDEAMDEAFDDAADGRLSLAAVEADPEQLRTDLENGIEILRRWQTGAQSIQRSNDNELQALQDTLHEVVRQAREDANAKEIDTEEQEAAFRQNRTVLLFSYYKDTVDWIYEYLQDIVICHLQS